MKNTTNEPQHGTRKLLKEANVAIWLNVSKRTLQGWRLRGEGPHFEKLGRSVRYLPAAVEAWISEQERSSTSASSPPPVCNAQENASSSDLDRGDEA
ncbi:helix-turn-helix domain-containing protein [Alteriqipengyuania sp. WL0013]|uniref:helix-turn-helix transcriptional regulator n=1 Tax=Alteriqipengyuania sp. WL0013 TaxID=3110773 RepID=UPI002CAE3E4E|nr:helix-turn-helix domain-containing protein [Alteriqipengyuania sp. WL0013]MEB3415010.1 helix-turn-helix domain-containing protein [Alteriqipengyuania sp. WL0013]